MKTSQQLVSEAKTRIREISVDELHHILESSSSEIPPVLIDVREPEEYLAGHIPGAVNFPRGVLEMQLTNHPSVAGLSVGEALMRMEDVPVYLICRSGARSALAAGSLQCMGLHQPVSVAGGMTAWNDKGWATVD